MKWHNLPIIWSIVYGLLVLKGNQAKTVQKRSVMDNLNDGLKVAGQMFGINTAADVANLVAKAFSNNNISQREKPDLFSLLQNGMKVSPSSQPHSSENYGNRETNHQSDHQTKASATTTPQKDAAATANFSTSDLISSMLRMVGFDATKLGALAINALIMLASALGNTIMGTAKSPHKGSATLDDNRFNPSNANVEKDNAETGPEEKYSPNDHQPRALNDATTMEWFLQNSPHKVKNILKEATHTELADKLINMVANYASEQGQAHCLKMLVCKSSPFIWGMQRSVRKHIEPKKNNESIHTNDEENLKEDADQNVFNVKSFFTHMPSIKEYREHGEKCEKQYAIHCNMTNLYDKKY